MTTALGGPIKDDPTNGPIQMQEFIDAFNDGTFFFLPIGTASPDEVRVKVFKEYVAQNLKEAILHPLPANVQIGDTLDSTQYLPTLVHYWSSVPTDGGPDGDIDVTKAKENYASLQSAYIQAMDRSLEYHRLKPEEQKGLNASLDVFDNVMGDDPFDDASDYRNLTPIGLRTFPDIQTKISDYIGFVIDLGNVPTTWTGAIDEDAAEDKAMGLSEDAAQGNMGAVRMAALGQASVVGNPIGEEMLEKLEVSEQNQCLLMSMIYDANGFVRLSAAAGGKYQKRATNDSTERPYYGRIVPVHPSDSDMHCNYFLDDGKAKNFFTELDADAIAETSMIKQLFYVFEDGSKVKEVKFPLSNTEQVQDGMNKLSEAYKSGTPTAEESLEAKSTDVKNAEGDVYKLDSIKIEYNGTNPSTARNDVKVDISFELANFACLNVDRVTYNKGGKEKKLGLKDLIIAPITDDGSGAGLSSLRSNYTPQHNRIRLKVIPAGRKKGGKTIGNVPIVLDLTTIDHEISRNANDGKVSLTIKYRGFLQSMLNMPYADTLITETGRDSRKRRHDNIETLIGEDCKPSTIREIMRVERASFQQESKDAFGDIINRIFTRDNIYVATFQPSALGETDLEVARAKALENIPEAGDQGFIKVVGVMDARSAGGLETLTEIVNSEEAKKDGILFDTELKDLSTDAQTWFFTFGDLLNSIIDNLYATNSDSMAKDLEALRLKFMTFPFRVPAPHKNGGFVEINPVIIPIDLYFFSEWFHSAVVKKDLKIYPVGAFARDILERLLNNLLYEVCLNHLLPDEKPPKLRMAFFSSTSKHVGSSSFYAKPKKPYFTFKGVKKVTDDEPKVINEYDYVVFYQSKPPFMRELQASKKTTIKEDPHVPTLVTGIFAKQYSYVEQVAFSKNTAPFLREARYFNNQFGPLALMNNVYDLTFEINKKMPNSYFLPGVIFNFILADFEQPPKNATSITPRNYPTTSNDPHHRKKNSVTIAHILGFGGYYITTKVTYVLRANEGDWGITVTSKFLGTDADSVTNTTEKIKSIETDNQPCFDAYNTAVREFTTELSGSETAFDIALGGSVGTDGGKGPVRLFETGPGGSSIQLTANGKAQAEAQKLISENLVDPSGTGKFTFTAAAGTTHTVTYDLNTGDITNFN